VPQKRDHLYNTANRENMEDARLKNVGKYKM
jgi:hypothetical protein